MAIVVPTIDFKQPTTGKTFVDLSLELVPQQINARLMETPDEFPIAKDVALDYDEDAIANSIHNIFSAVPGDYVLAPAFGSSLNQMVFEPVNDTTARTIGLMIVDLINTWEPRVNVVDLPIQIKEDRQGYQFAVIMEIPLLSRRSRLGGELTRDNGFNIVRPEVGLDFEQQPFKF